MDFLKEKDPSWGLKSKEKVGLEEGLFVEKEKLAEIIKGESLGEPYRPIPDLSVRVKGGAGVVVVVVLVVEVE